MKPASALLQLLELLLGVAVVLAAVQLSEHARLSRLELGRARLLRLDDALRAELAALPDRAFLTYYVSAREAMPSHLRRLEQDVGGLLAAMKAAAPGRLDYQIVDPDSDPELAAFAARRKVAPVRVRHVARDSYSEREIWSTLTLACGPGTPAMIQGLTDEHLPRLQGLLVEQLRVLRSTPPRPTLALAAGPGFERFAAWLGAHGALQRVDLAAGEPLPEDADILFWMDPAGVGAGQLAALERLLGRGRCIVVAGSRQAGTVQAELPGLELLVTRPTGYDGEALWGRFGLRPFPGLVFDERCQMLGDGGPPLPFRVNSIANHQDFHALAFEPNGNLVFELPTPLEIDRGALEARGWTADVLATSSPDTWTQALEADGVPLGMLRKELGEPLPKQPLVTWLRPADPWQGSLVAVASSSPFRDEFFGAAGTAHERLAQVFVDTLAAPDRLVLTHAEWAASQPLPALGSGERVLWRSLAVLLPPLLLLALAWWRRTPGAAAARRLELDLSWVPGLLLRALPALALLLAAVAFAGGELQLTDDGLGALHPHTRSLAAAAVGEGALHAELFVSDRGLLPPELRPPVDRLRRALDDLGSAGAELRLDVVHPEQLDEAGQQALRAAGIAPNRVTSRREEATEVRSVWSSLRLSARGRSETLSFADAAAFENLEFRLAFALQRLASGRQVHIAFASDTPRLSAAERHRYYQEQGLIPPLGKDEYSLARALLAGVDFRVTHVDTEDPVLPPQVDALVWLQPRRPVERMLPVFVEHLYRGGHALLAAQHFNIQPQQFRGSNFDFVYWPRPQTNDLEMLWFPEFGVSLVREVLFDELSLPLELESQVNVTEKRDFKSMRSALPFNLRAIGAHFARDDVVTARLGDQAFLWSSFLTWDEARLMEAGLAAEPLISTSPRSWTYDWSGGFLPDEALSGTPGELIGERSSRVLGARLAGSFPWPAASLTREGSEQALPPPDQHAPGELLFLACSELFKDSRLTGLAPEFRGDHLLLNAVASLSLDEGLAAVMARRPVARGFDPPPEGERLRWRGLVVFGMPGAYLLLGLLRGLLAGRRR